MMETTLNRLLRREEERLTGTPVDKLPDDLRKAIEETRKEIRDAFKDGAKFPAKLK